MQPLHEGTGDDSIRTAMDRSLGPRERAAFALFAGRELAPCCENSVDEAPPRLASHHGHGVSSEQVEGEGKGHEGGSGSDAGSGSGAGSESGSGSGAGSGAESGFHNRVGSLAKGGHSPGETTCTAKQSASRPSLRNHKRRGCGHPPRKRERPRETEPQQSAPRSPKRPRPTEPLQASTADHDVGGSSLATSR